MTELADVTINGAPYMLAAGGYERAAEAPAPAKPGRLSLSTFSRGLGIVSDDQPPGQEAPGAGGGWSGLGVHSAAGGSGLEPWPRLLSYTDSALLDLPSPAARAAAIVAGNNVFLHVGRRLYRTPALDAAAWANLTAVVTLIAGLTVKDVAYFRDDVLVLSGGANNILRWDTSAGILSTWRSGEAGAVGHGYGGAVMYAKELDNNLERLYFGLSRYNDSPETKSRWLDAPLIRMGLHAGKLAIATKTSLYLLGGEPYEGVAGDGGGTARWDGPAEPFFSHGAGVNPLAGDFVFLQSLQGRLYTWLAGSVVEYDPGTGRAGWRRTRPAGARCTGGCVAAGYLVVALETAEGRAQVWAFDGLGWWRLIDTAAPGSVWPVALHGAGGYDLLLLTAGQSFYQLGRLADRGATAPSYALAGSWASPLLAAGNADSTKAWRKLAAYFAWPEVPGNDASADSVTISLDYSVTAGATWVQVATASVAAGHTQQLDYVFTAPPVSRLLQLRVRWDSVADWAPILSRLIVDYATIDTSPRRRRWQLKVTARDRAPRRDGGLLVASGRQQIDALWSAWRDQTTITFRDVDYDTTPSQVTVRVLDIAEAAPKASDAGRWGDGVVTLLLAEV